jgi:hypothetical protein|tara:strand:- start:16478 stop:16669 length:192 start_codon:yes stop_codon:yes gene_type:complete
MKLSEILNKDEKERDEEFAEASKIVEKLVLQGAEEILEQLMQYPTEQIVKSKHKTLKIKVTIV